MSRTRLIKSVTLMMVAALMGKALYIIREPIIAAYFGASAQTDAYNVAMTIITMLLSVTISPIGSVLVPVYVERLHRDEAEGERFIQQVLTLYLLILSSVLLVAYFAAPWLVHLYAPGFASETTALAVGLTRILAFFAVASGLAGYFNMVLTAHQVFLWVALGPIVTAVLVIIILLAAASCLGIDALAWGMVVGNAVQMFILGLSTRRQAVRLGLDFRLGEAVRALGKLSGWMLVGRFIGQGNNLIDRNMLSFLSEGSIAALGFARSIYLLPFSIFTTGITRVIIANFSWDVAQGDMDTLKRDLSLSIRMAAFFMAPMTVGFIVLRDPIVQVFLERGAFEAKDAKVTAALLSLLSIGLFFRSINFIVGRIYTSMQSLAFPTLLGFAALCIHYTVNAAMITKIGVAGVALSLTVTEIFVALSFIVRTRQMLGPLGGKRTSISLIKVSTASGIMAMILSLSTGFFAIQGKTGITTLFTLVMITFIGLAFYIIALYILKSEELLLSIRFAIKALERQLPFWGVDDS